MTIISNKLFGIGNINKIVIYIDDVPNAHILPNDKVFFKTSSRKL